VVGEALLETFLIFEKSRFPHISDASFFSRAAWQQARPLALSACGRTPLNVHWCPLSIRLPINTEKKSEKSKEKIQADVGLTVGGGRGGTRGRPCSSFLNPRSPPLWRMRAYRPRSVSEVRGQKVGMPHHGSIAPRPRSRR